MSTETSPYLLRHENNPVDWYPWGNEAFEVARSKDLPIFLSVGYSSCYWCHVMERESFSSPEVAELMNRSFINIKVDREERPDVDEIYMAATQLLADHTGWPNSVFLTPDLEPFFAGTYFSPEDGEGRPGFGTVLAGLAAAWVEQRDRIYAQVAEVMPALKGMLLNQGEPLELLPARDLSERCVKSLEGVFDATWGGFGRSPKFPTPANLFLLSELAPQQPSAQEMLTRTLDSMARGGLHDQLGGGFHRYCVDRQWLVPHFEKLLSDNGLLLELFAVEAARTADPEFARIARQTATFIASNLVSDDGGLWSAIDAETNGREGEFYVWNRAQIEAALSAEDAAFLAPIYGFGGRPLFENGCYVLHLPQQLADQARARRLSTEQLIEQVEPLRRTMLDVRAKRDNPPVDRKVLTDWNGIGIAGLAVAGHVLGEKSFVDSARRAAHFVLAALQKEQGLMHCWSSGRATVDGVLSDYVYLVRGLLRLYSVTGESDWLTRAEALAEQQHRRLHDTEGGGFFTAVESPGLLTRSKEVFDGSVPSANAIAVLNSIELERELPGKGWGDVARSTLASFAGIVNEQPATVPTFVLGARSFEAMMATSAGKPEILETVVDVQQSDQEIVGRILIKLDPGWHIGEVTEDPAKDERWTLVWASDAHVRRLEAPPGDWLEPNHSSLRVSRDSVEIRIELTQLGEQPKIHFRYQACDHQRCLLPRTAEVCLS